ncbi:hypothetical protein MYCTH_2297084 [Thermothelomyces thermophilus ATCC 42464]|uniref:Co-chaperone HscB C-terminal oligomerisation domain-containing protein n=1 Tax=Thermothelomyces thermophilus (strain ATCC 42464 / BCRC 31852 / DSM 1799) TaxID=573729 RepID=G2Q477_THET4|nr:uncharacterized protein MYCTH_2297084 [Thermothelomyces thermophilus ATCC 42464]AEO54472.1 hypothetical protein MYCTH_2297084 [Thermothelomyces thermophilus ATCC 42464]
MRASLASHSGRAATYLCAACRREARAFLDSQGALIRAVPVAPSRRNISTIAIPADRRSSAQRWPSTRQTRSATTRASPDATTPSSTPSQPSSIPTYYALFPETLPDGPPPKGKFAIDLRALRNEFLRLQAASHPDFHHHAAASEGQSPATEKSSSGGGGGGGSGGSGNNSNSNSNNNGHKSAARIRAEATSALINAAYKTLSSPLLRAQYLLREQYGVDLEADERGAQSGAPDPELLMTVLEAREAIEEAEREEDLEEVAAANEARIGESERLVGEALESGDVEAAKEEAVRLRYWVNIRESVRNWEKGKPVVLQH